MFFFFSKILYFLLSPFLWITLLLILAIWRYKQRKRFLITALVVMLFFGNKHIIMLLCLYWSHPVQNPAKITKQYDYVVVLSGFSGVTDDEKVVNFYDGVDRMNTALWLYKQGKVSNIIISGGSGKLTDQQEKESVFVADYLNKVGIPDSCLIVEDLSRNTHENALFTKKWLDDNDSTASVLLITSALHVPRAWACFSKEGVVCDVLSVDPVISGLDWTPDSFLPASVSFTLWEMFSRELIGYWSYKAMGYL